MGHMMPFGSHLFQILGFLVWGAFMLVVGFVVVAVVILLVRFLWFGTKAAQLYIASQSASVAAPVDSVPDATVPVTPDASGPVPKVRKPKS
jgi:hypothetical protein